MQFLLVWLFVKKNSIQNNLKKENHCEFSNQYKTDTDTTQVRQTETRMLNRCIIVAVMKNQDLRQPNDDGP